MAMSDYHVVGDPSLARPVPAPHVDADNVVYDNTSSGMTATNVQDALDELASGSGGGAVTGVKGDSESTYRTGNVNITKANIGLSDVNNTSDADKPISTATQTALNGKLDTSLKGANSGLAELDSNGKVPNSQLPGYVDDVLEYASLSVFPATGESGKIYVALDTNKTYRWSGTTYIEISPSLALGETSSTAYRGDRGKTAYDHSQSDHSNIAPAFSEASTRTNIASGDTIATILGKIKKWFTDIANSIAFHDVDGSTIAIGYPSIGSNATLYSKCSKVHYDSTNKQLEITTKSGASATEVDTVPIFSGNYNDLSNKPSIPAAQVQSNWNETNTSSKAYIKNKPTIPTMSGILDTVYPVGSIYMSVNDTNPSTLFGGTWVAWGSGRVPIGVNANDTDFNTVEETGGNKTLDLTHKHTYGVALSSYYGSATAETNITLYNVNKWESLSSQYIGGKVNARNSNLAIGTYNENIGIFGSTAQTSNSLTQSQSILQPYITCYMWKRTL